MKRLLLAVAAVVLAACRYYRFETRPQTLAKADVIIVPGVALTKEGEVSWIMHNRVLMGKVWIERRRRAAGGLGKGIECAHAPALP